MIKKQIIGYTLALSLILASLFTAKPVFADISAGKYFNVKYTHTKKTYSKKAIAARYQNTLIKSTMPGFVDSSYSMYSAYYLAKNGKKLGLTYKYNSSTKKITMKRSGKTLVMTLNSKKATLNGKSTTLSKAPIKVYFISKKKNYIMIPGATVAGKLGLKYSWNQRLLSGIFSLPSASTTTATTASKTPTSSAVVAPKTKITASSSNYSIRIKKPSGLSNSSITSEDDYNNKRLQLKIKGDYRTHFTSSSNRTIRNSLSYSVSYQGGYTYINLKTSSIKGFSTTVNSTYIYVTYAAPTSMYQKIIVVDAGHGGTDSGAVGNGLYEKNLTLSIVKQIKYYFDRNANYKVYYTRLTDTYPSLSARYTLANNVGAHRFLSVHINSATASSKGTETLYYSKGGKTGTLTGKGLATIVQSKLQSTTKFTNRGLQDRIPGKNPGGVAVLTYTKMAASLGEVGFITNKTEATYMKNNTAAIGKAFYNGILSSY
ncbi:MAG: N-acetylmuramoyl-L-alanine amidase [Anaerostipes sp.]|nr:N-acetylmuramoyl-L-alanine amidase [Anaerostipes sp.]MDD3746070.1 N-acetylmuramoyl-L-alanine amidase [Anaerostipes sp.]